MEHINPYDTKQFGSIDRAIILNPAGAGTLSLKLVKARVYIHADAFRHALNTRWLSFFKGRAAIEEIFPA